jgi:hypothetical protein
MRFLRAVFLTLAGAALGAVLGRLVAGLRRESQGEEAMAFDAGSLTPSPQELVPGIVAAMRVTDAPWSALHVPPWLAAFVVNFSMAALGRELGPLLKTFGFGGNEDDSMARPGDIWTVEARPAAEPAWASAPAAPTPPPPPAAPTPPPAPEPEAAHPAPEPTPAPRAETAPPPPPAPEPRPAPASGGFTPTSNGTPPTAPPPANGEHPGFQPSRG